MRKGTALLQQDVELAVPLLGLLHLHRMMSNSVPAVIITTAPTAIPTANN